MLRYITKIVIVKEKPWPVLSWSNWNLKMLVFVEGSKLENLKKNPRSKV